LKIIRIGQSAARFHAIYFTFKIINTRKKKKMKKEKLLESIIKDNDVVKIKFTKKSIKDLTKSIVEERKNLFERLKNA
jgi:hypothetical protein